MAPVAEIVRMHELRMQAHAGFFDLGDPSDKRRSAAALVDLYFALLAALNPPLSHGRPGRAARPCPFASASCLQDCRIVAFEPNPYNIEHYRQRFDYGKKRVVYEHLALADMPAELPFFVREICQRRQSSHGDRPEFAAQANRAEYRL